MSVESREGGARYLDAWSARKHWVSEDATSLRLLVTAASRPRDSS